MASLPNCGALDLTAGARDFIRPRRSQDANVHLMQLAAARQKNVCQASLAGHEAHAQWEAHHALDARAMSNLQTFLGSTGASSNPTGAAPSPASLDVIDGSLESLYCSPEVTKPPYKGHTPFVPRRPQKRAASRSCEHQAPAKRGAPYSRERCQFQPSLEAVSGSATTTTNWGPGQLQATLGCIQPTQPSPTTYPSTLEENTTAAIVASWCKALPQGPSNSWETLNSTQLNMWHQSHATASASSFAAPLATACMPNAAGYVTQTGEVLNQCPTLSHPSALMCGSYAVPYTSAPCIGQLQEATECVPQNLPEGSTLSQLHQLHAAGYPHGISAQHAQHAAHMHGGNDQMSEQWPAVGSNMGYAPVATDVMTCLMNAASAEAQLTQLQSVLSMSSGAAISVDQSTHITPAAMNTLNSAHSVHTAAQPPASDPFSYLQPSAAQCWPDAHEQHDQLSHAFVPAPEAMHAQQAGFQGIPEEAPEMFTAPQRDACVPPEVFETIQQHDAFKTRSLSPIRTICKDDCPAAAIATHDFTTQAVPLATTAMPLMPDTMHPVHASMIPELDVAPIVAGTADIPTGMEMLQATAAALGMLEFLQPVEQMWQGDHAAPVADVLAAAAPVRHAYTAGAAYQASAQGWDYNGREVILISP